MSLQQIAVPEFSVLSVDPGFDFTPLDFGDGQAFKTFAGNSNNRQVFSYGGIRAHQIFVDCSFNTLLII